MVRAQLWLWFLGIMVMTLPWHVLGLFGQPRRVPLFDHNDPRIAWWGPWTIVSTVGGFVMLAGALLLLRNLASAREGAPAADRRMRYALAGHPLERLPSALNGFGLWNSIVAVLMLIAYAYPIAQFFIVNSKPALVHHVDYGG